MCGIVGYVGRTMDDTALEVVMEGLPASSTAATTRPGSPSSPTTASTSEKRAGKLENLRSALEAHPLAASRTGIGHTRWATHGGPTDGNAHPHRGGDDGRLALIHNGIIENFHALKKELLAEGVEFRSETDTEVAAKLVGREYDRVGDLTDAMRNVVQRLEGAFTLLAVHADSPASSSAPAATARSSSASATARTSSAPTSRRSSATPATRSSSARTRSSRSPPTATTVINFDGTPAEGKAYEVTWDAAAAEKGGYATFMEKEIHDQPHAVADTLLGRTDDTGRLVLDEVRISEEQLRAGRPHHHRRLRHGRLRRHGRQVRDRALDPHPGRGRASPTSSATATRSSTSARSSCRSASPARRWTR